MNTYSITNQSDDVTIQADHDLVAAAVAIVLGEGRYGAKLGERVVCPIFLFGGYEEWAAEVGFGPEFITANWRKIAACLRSAAIGMPPPEVRSNARKLAAWNDQKTTSLSNICALAIECAESLEAKFKPAGAAATR